MRDDSRRYPGYSESYGGIYLTEALIYSCRHASSRESFAQPAVAGEDLDGGGYGNLEELAFGGGEADGAGTTNT